MNKKKKTNKKPENPGDPLAKTSASTSKKMRLKI